MLPDGNTEKEKKDKTKVKRKKSRQIIVSSNDDNDGNAAGKGTSGKTSNSCHMPSKCMKLDVLLPSHRGSSQPAGTPVTHVAASVPGLPDGFICNEMFWHKSAPPELDDMPGVTADALAILQRTLPLPYHLAPPMMARHRLLHKRWLAHHILTLLQMH
jgi:hypothetical protein